MYRKFNHVVRTPHVAISCGAVMMDLNSHFRPMKSVRSAQRDAETASCIEEDAEKRRTEMLKANLLLSYG